VRVRGGDGVEGGVGVGFACVDAYKQILKRFKII